MKSPLNRKHQHADYLQVQLSEPYGDGVEACPGDKKSKIKWKTKSKKIENVRPPLEYDCVT
jgi:hypothetical protein